MQKLDTKQAVEEMGTRVEEARNKCHEDHMAGTRAKEAKEPKTTKKMPGKTPKRPPKGRKAAQSSSDEDNDEAEDSFHSDQEEVNISIISGSILSNFRYSDFRYDFIKAGMPEGETF